MAKSKSTTKIAGELAKDGGSFVEKVQNAKERVESKGSVVATEPKPVEIPNKPNRISTTQIDTRDAVKAFQENRKKLKKK